jgi:hypothetical protein
MMLREHREREERLREALPIRDDALVRDTIPKTNRSSSIPMNSRPVNSLPPAVMLAVGLKIGSMPWGT